MEEDASIKPSVKKRAETLCPRKEKRTIRQRLLRWFARNQRPLPWRQARDPYAIWVSEVMLQQTQVATVVPYYQRFLKTFPTVRSLARADLSKVLRVWEGMGYYARARALHHAAKIIVERFGGRLPDGLEALQSLPGIGRSTAGAILSIAYNRKAPVLDGNVKRVLSRLFAISEEPKRTKTQDLLWEIAQSLLPQDQAGAFNQALMDLGATICIPRNPACSKCPLHSLCKGLISGAPEKYPPKVRRKALPHIRALGAVIQRNGRVLLRRRPAEGLLGGLWEFPSWPYQGEIDPQEELHNLLEGKRGHGVKVGRLLGIFEQTFTHLKLTLYVFACRISSGAMEGEWIRVKDLSSVPMSRLHRKIVSRLFNTSRSTLLTSHSAFET